MYLQYSLSWLLQLIHILFSLFFFIYILVQFNCFSFLFHCRLLYLFLSPFISLCLFGRFIILHVLFDNWMNLSWLKTQFYLFITLWLLSEWTSTVLILHTHTHLLIQKTPKYNPTYWTNNFIWLIIVESTKWEKNERKKLGHFLPCFFFLVPRFASLRSLFLRVCHPKKWKIVR